METIMCGSKQHYWKAKGYWKHMPIRRLSCWKEVKFVLISAGSTSKSFLKICFEVHKTFCLFLAIDRCRYFMRWSWWFAFKNVGKEMLFKIKRCSNVNVFESKSRMCKCARYVHVWVYNIAKYNLTCNNRLVIFMDARVEIICM